jgi:hypothetical protein
MFFCFQDESNECRAEFLTWEEFSVQLIGQLPTEVASSLQKQQIDCVFGGIDLSIQ